MSKLVQRRRLAYQRVFLDGDGKRPNPDGDVILKDLMTFCYGHKAAVVHSAISGTYDPMASALAQGRQEVLRRILEYLYLDDRYIINARPEVSDYADT